MGKATAALAYLILVRCFQVHMASRVVKSNVSQGFAPQNGGRDGGGFLGGVIGGSGVHWPWGRAARRLLEASGFAKRATPQVSKLTNEGDVVYTSLITVGGQTLRGVFDTSSFEVFIFSKECVMCGESPLLYDHARSLSYNTTGFLDQQQFGDATVTSREASDVAQFGPFGAEEVHFWEIRTANRKIHCGSFEALVGLGPPRSGVDFAIERARLIHEQRETILKSGRSVTNEIEKAVDHANERVGHAREMAGFIRLLDIHTMSICLGAESGSDGIWIWNDDSVLTQEDRFTSLDVTSETHWSLSLTSAKLWHATDIPASEDFVTMQPATIGCSSSQPCDAIFDTSFALIAAPQEAVSHVDDMIRSWRQAGGNCEDLSNLPDLVLDLNGKSFSLPPEAYIARIVGVAPKDMTLVSGTRDNRTVHGDCHSLFVSLGPSLGGTPSWIIGMPFFRRFYTSFQYVKEEGFRPRASRLSFSVADTECRPSRQAGVSFVASVTHVREGSVSQRPVKLRVDASKLRWPQALATVKGRSPVRY